MMIDTATRPYRVLVADPTRNEEWIETHEATSYGEALTMAERNQAGRLTVGFGIPYDSYDLARAEGLDFNDADGLLI